MLCSPLQSVTTIHTQLQSVTTIHTQLQSVTTTHTVTVSYNYTHSSAQAWTKDSWRWCVHVCVFKNVALWPFKMTICILIKIHTGEKALMRCTSSNANPFSYSHPDQTFDKLTGRGAHHWSSEIIHSSDLTHQSCGHLLLAVQSTLFNTSYQNKQSYLDLTHKLPTLSLHCHGILSSAALYLPGKQTLLRHV